MVASLDLVLWLSNVILALFYFCLLYFVKIVVLTTYIPDMSAGVIRCDFIVFTKNESDDYINSNVF